MKKKYPNEFKFFDEEEKDLIESFERGEWKSIMTPELKKQYQEAARNTSSDYREDKIEALHLEVKEETVKKLKSRAKKQGIPYKELAASVLQKFVNNL